MSRGERAFGHFSNAETTETGGVPNGSRRPGALPAGVAPAPCAGIRAWQRKRKHSGAGLLLTTLPLLLLSGCQSNLAWVGDKEYVPPAATRIQFDGFGIDDQVDVLPSGNLPISFQRRITNTGSRAVPAGYQITESVSQLAFQSVAGTAGYVPGDPALFTVLTCTQPGPALPPGGSELVTFTFPSAACTPGPGADPQPITGLNCGMYRETLTIDATGVVAESNEGDNTSNHFFFVPSPSPRINLVTTLNPNNDPRIGIIPVQQVQVPVFQFPGPGPVTVATHQLMVRTSPPGGQFFVSTTTPQASRVGNVVTVGFVPALPPMGTPSSDPQTININLTFDPAALGPLSNRPDGLYEEEFSIKVTSISTDGCLIRQETLLLKAVHEVGP